MVWALTSWLQDTMSGNWCPDSPAGTSRYDTCPDSPARTSRYDTCLDSPTGTSRYDTCNFCIMVWTLTLMATGQNGWQVMGGQSSNFQQKKMGKGSQVNSMGIFLSVTLKSYEGHFFLRSLVWKRSQLKFTNFKLAFWAWFIWPTYNDLSRSNFFSLGMLPKDPYIQKEFCSYSVQLYMGMTYHGYSDWHL